MKVLTAVEMAATDRATIAAGTSMATLMRNAGSAVATFVIAQYPQAKRITVLCGTGNNGGDGFVAARALTEAARQVAVLLVGEESKLHGEAMEAYESLHASDAAIFALEAAEELPGIEALLTGADLLIDAVTGTGFKPPLRVVAAALRDRVAKLKVPVVAVDLPTGWDADSDKERSEEAFRADAVVTFTAPKLAHVFGHLTTATFGSVVVADIGSPEETIASESRLQWSGSAKRITEKPRTVNSNKGMYGRVTVIGGALGKAGAPAMASLACLRAGAGLVTAAVPRSVLNTVAAVAPELMCMPLDEDGHGALTMASLDALLKNEEKLNVSAIGPGLGTADETSQLVREYVQRAKNPLVLDADGLNAFEDKVDLLSGEGRVLVLTPHPGEMARLLGCSTKEVEADRINLARKFATEHHLTLVLKGWRTLIAHPDGSVALNTSGHPAMAKGGSGDILTGIIAAMLGQYRDDVAAAVNAAVYLHGLAANFAATERNEHTILATDTVAHLSSAFDASLTDENGFTWIRGLHA